MSQTPVDNNPEVLQTNELVPGYDLDEPKYIIIQKNPYIVGKPVEVKDSEGKPVLKEYPSKVSANGVISRQVWGRWDYYKSGVLLAQEKGDLWSGSFPNSYFYWSDPIEVSLRTLRTWILDGFCIRPAVCSNKKDDQKPGLLYFQTESSDYTFIDLDDASPELHEQVLNDPVIRSASFFANHSASMKKGDEKLSSHFSFAYDRTVTDYRDHQKITISLYHYLSRYTGKSVDEGILDSKCYDPTRLKYGINPEKGDLRWKELYFDDFKVLSVDYWLKYFDDNSLSIGSTRSNQTLQSTGTNQTLQSTGTKSKDLTALPNWYLALNFAYPEIDWTNPNSFIPWQGFSGWVEKKLTDNTHTGEECLQWDCEDYRDIYQGLDEGLSGKSKGSINITVPLDGGIPTIYFCNAVNWRVSNGGNFGVFILDWFLANQEDFKILKDDPEQLKKAFQHYQLRLNPTVDKNDLWNDALKFYIQSMDKDFSKYEQSYKELKSVTVESYNQKRPDSRSGDCFQIVTTFDDLVYTQLFKNGEGQYLTHQGSYFQYDESVGIWRKLRDTRVMSLISKFARQCYYVNSDGQAKFKYATSGNVKSSFSYACAALNQENEFFENQHRYIGFTNGTYDLQTQQLVEHDRLHGCTFGFNFPYQIEVLDPIYQEFFLKCYGEDQIPKIRAFLRSVIDTHDHSSYFLHIIGASGSGKGTYLRLIHKLFDDKANSENKLSILSDADKRRQFIFNMRLFLSHDVDTEMKQIKDFFDLVDDTKTSMRSLFSSETINQKVNVKFMMASVKNVTFPGNTEASDGWDRRVRRLYTLGTSLEDYDNYDRLLQTKLPNLVGWALGLSLKESRQILLDWNNTGLALDNHDEVIAQSDSVSEFLDRCCTSNKSDKSVLIDLDQLHSFYCAYISSLSIEFRSKPKGYNSFLASIERMLPKLYTKPHTATVQDCPELSKAERLRLKIKTQVIDILVIPGLFQYDETDIQRKKYLCNRNHISFGGLKELKNHTPSEIKSYSFPITSDSYVKYQQGRNSNGSANGVLMSPLVEPVLVQTDEIINEMD